MIKMISLFSLYTQCLDFSIFVNVSTDDLSLSLPLPLFFFYHIPTFLPGIFDPFCTHPSSISFLQFYDSFRSGPPPYPRNFGLFSCF